MDMGAPLEKSKRQKVETSKQTKKAETSKTEIMMRPPAPGVSQSP
jgi:hypothetical protein